MAEGMVAREPGSISRRRVLIGTAWATPTIVLAVAVPQAAASTGEDEAETFSPGVEVILKPVLSASQIEPIWTTPGVMQVDLQIFYAYFFWDLDGVDEFAITHPIEMSWKLQVFDAEGNLLGTRLSLAPATIEPVDGSYVNDSTTFDFVPPEGFTMKLTMTSKSFTTPDGTKLYKSTTCYGTYPMPDDGPPGDGGAL